MRPQPLLLVGLLTFVIGLSGCSKSETVTNPEDTHIKNIAVMYGQYLGSHKGQPPTNEAAFKKHLQMVISARQVQATPEEWLTSPRDNEPYGVRYGALGNTDKAVFVYEKTGKSGKRFVGYANGAVEEVDEAKFKQLVPNP